MTRNDAASFSDWACGIAATHSSVPCPLWVRSGHVRCKKRCPLCPRQRPRKRTPAEGHFRLPSKAVMCAAARDVRFGPIADMEPTSFAANRSHRRRLRAMNLAWRDRAHAQSCD